MDTPNKKYTDSFLKLVFKYYSGCEISAKSFFENDYVWDQKNSGIIFLDYV